MGRQRYEVRAIADRICAAAAAGQLGATPAVPEPFWAFAVRDHR
jgi:hypothetical protein